MNKLYIVTAMALASISLASAQVGGTNQMPGKPANMARPTGEREDRPQKTTLSGPVAEQIRALNKEMESKIQAIRDDYMAKIKAILESNKVAPRATTTPPGMMRGEKRGMDEGRKMGVPFMQGTGTRPIMREGEQPRPQDQQGGQGFGEGFRGFFRGFFGGNQ